MTSFGWSLLRGEQGEGYGAELGGQVARGLAERELVGVGAEAQEERDERELVVYQREVQRGAVLVVAGPDAGAACEGGKGCRPVAAMSVNSVLVNPFVARETLRKHWAEV